MSRINSKQHETREALKTKKTDLDKVTGDLDGLAGLDALDGKVKVAETLERGIRSVRTEIKDLDVLIIDLNEVGGKLARVKPMAGLGAKITNLLGLQKELERVE